MSTLRAALESALSENPDDLVTCAAYADLLAEDADPLVAARGEFMQVQLALEDASMAGGQRAALQQQERDLLARHERAWLGELAPYLLDGKADELHEDYYAADQSYTHRWQRGQLAAVEVHFLTRVFAQTLAEAPAASLLRELRIHNDSGGWGDAESDQPPHRVSLPEGANEEDNVFELLGAPFLQNLRVFQMGDETGGDEGWTDCHCFTPQLQEVVAAMPRIEELLLMTKGLDVGRLFALPNLTHLRVLHVEHESDYPVERLAANPALTNLTRLFFHPHFDDDEGFLPYHCLSALVHSKYLGKLTHLHFRVSSAGNEGMALLVESGVLGGLRVLDLRHGCVTDAGAQVLAGCPDTARLELLDLSRNQLTGAGIAALRSAGVHLRADDQHPEGSDEYLMEGDFE